MKLKELKTLVDDAWKGFIASVQSMRVNAQKRMDKENSLTLASICMTYDIELPSSYRDLDQPSFNMTIKPFIADDGRADFYFVKVFNHSKFFPLSWERDDRENFILPYLLEYKKFICDSYDKINESRWLQALCNGKDYDDLPSIHFFSDADAFLTQEERDYIFGTTKSSIRSEIIKEHKKTWSLPVAPHHVRNNKTIRGHYVSRGSKGAGWRKRHDVFDKNNKKQYRCGSGKYDVAIYSRKERCCSEIRAHKRSQF